MADRIGAVSVHATLSAAAEDRILLSDDELTQLLIVNATATPLYFTVGMSGTDSTFVDSGDTSFAPYDVLPALPAVGGTNSRVVPASSARLVNISELVKGYLLARRGAQNGLVIRLIGNANAYSVEGLRG